MTLIDNKDYNLNLSNFNGPLDLLLALVREKQMDVLSIDLVELANEYIKIIDTLKNDNIDLAGDYLVMASTLLQIKAYAIIAPPQVDKSIEHEKQNLLSKLIERQQFKNIAQLLRSKEVERKNIFIKHQSAPNNYQYEIDESHLDGKLDTIKIIMALRKMFERTNAQHLRQATIEKSQISPAQRRLEIIATLKQKANPSFTEIFTTPSINHFVVTIITILDMARKQELMIKQTQQFGTITIARGEINGL